MNKELLLTDKEIFFENEEIIVSKTNLKGHITYANDVFLKIAGYTESEILGQPHSILRHPDMPRCVFKLLWIVLEQGKEIFAYVKNRTKTGDYYWVFAQVTPSFDKQGNIISYHSTRRVPERRVIDEIIAPLYRDLLAEEARHSSHKEGMDAAFNMVLSLLNDNNMEYDEFILTL